MKRFLIFSLLLAALPLGGCRIAEMWMVKPDGPPEYQLGWQDGCDSGFAAEGGMVYKAMYGFKKRPEMSENDQYKQGWNEGFTYCRFTLDEAQAHQWKNLDTMDE